MHFASALYWSIMLNFRKIDITDIELFKTLTQSTNEISCENAFVNLYVWQDVYHNMIAVKNDSLFIKSEEDGVPTFRLPIGGNMEKGLKEIISYCGGKMPRFWNPSGESLLRLPSWFYEKYDFHEERDAFDYIYLQSALSSLQGKKYHSKRNHISTFSKQYNWHYEKITDQNIGKVRLCAKEWYEKNVDRLDKYMLCEKKGVELILNNIKALNITGGAIFVEDKAVAFTLGSPINQNVFDIHIEKALPEFATAYTVINREFAANELQGYKYINREDDMGLEGLRKAKLSYKPEILLKKFFCTPKDEING